MENLLTSPWQLAVVIVLSVLSFFYSWRGFRERDVPRMLIGIGLSVPTFSMTSGTAWLIGVAMVGGGIYLQRRFEGL